jgi:hypothetical protein
MSRPDEACRTGLGQGMVLENLQNRYLADGLALLIEHSQAGAHLQALFLTQAEMNLKAIFPIRNPVNLGLSFPGQETFAFLGQEKYGPEG